MPEATMIILDNSDYSINGDYQPTRWLSQLDAAGLLIQAKLEQNHQNCMGIALSGGKHVEIVCTPSNDITKVTSFLYGIKQHGKQQLSVVLIFIFRHYRHQPWLSNIEATKCSLRESFALWHQLSTTIRRNSSLSVKNLKKITSPLI
jgi:hypothetical protein